VVVMNQMTTKIDFGQGQALMRDGGSDPQVQPAMGEAWAPFCVYRIILRNTEGQRTAKLFKSPLTQESIAPFWITANGVRDQPDPCQNFDAVDTEDTTEEDEADIYFWDRVVEDVTSVEVARD
ncbi:DNA repair protein rad51c, partial [Podila humilis]